MIAKLKKMIAERWGRIPANRRARLRVQAWWAVTILSALNLSTIILNFKDPSDAPIVGAIVSVAAYFWFTGQRTKQDGYAQDAERRLAEVSQMHLMHELDAIKASIANEAAERKGEDHKLAMEIFRQAESLYQRESGSLLSHRPKRPSAPPARLPPHPVTRIANYGEVRKSLKAAIKEHRAVADRLATMEAFAIIYGAAVSAFGSGFIRWWNA